jgi:16S rRNA G966 N2-methylase RsmD
LRAIRGDNLDVLRRHVGDESVDLVYLDPPFNSTQDDNAFFHEKDGTAAASQIKAFEDPWPSSARIAHRRKSRAVKSSHATLQRC